VVFGMGLGSTEPALCPQRDYFGRKCFTIIAGVQQPIVAIGTIMGPVYAGLVYDINQSYHLAYTICIPSITLGAVVCFLPILLNHRSACDSPSRECRR